ncbi:uncharacterized protein LOC110007549 [Amborella trichopoda]|uniref:uncharacterized protein LOC110007549 n=1 Tax=Amborella trichopoda TaxID=13333 RepID=UPI0009BF48C1|nr:uncharacterized protein LOC110007549 [Amborella trichopoda]|eukprot:XP_020524734.1 uncharacterized protein LOC110007549 [Amborella trichopoda]
METLCGHRNQRWLLMNVQHLARAVFFPYERPALSKGCLFPEGSMSSPTSSDEDNIGDTIEPNMGDTNEYMEQDTLLTTAPIKSTNMGIGEYGASSKGLEIEDPKIGMKFGSEEEACDYYKAYALACGFGVQRASTPTKDRRRE